MVIYDNSIGLGGFGDATKINFFDTQYADQGALMTGSNNIDYAPNANNAGKLLLLQKMTVSPLAMMHHKRVYTYSFW